jgi:hypothetical protein
MVLVVAGLIDVLEEAVNLLLPLWVGHRFILD